MIERVKQIKERQKVNVFEREREKDISQEIVDTNGRKEKRGKEKIDLSKEIVDMEIKRGKRER